MALIASFRRSMGSPGNVAMPLQRLTNTDFKDQKLCLYVILVSPIPVHQESSRKFEGDAACTGLQQY